MSAILSITNPPVEEEEEEEEEEEFECDNCGKSMGTDCGSCSDCIINGFKYGVKVGEDDEDSDDEDSDNKDWFCSVCGKWDGYNVDHREENDENDFTTFWCVSCYDKK